MTSAMLDAGVLHFDSLAKYAAASSVSSCSQGYECWVGLSASNEFAEGMTIDFVELEPGKRESIYLNPNDPVYVPPRKNI